MYISFFWLISNFHVCFTDSFTLHLEDNSNLGFLIHQIALEEGLPLENGELLRNSINLYSHSNEEYIHGEDQDKLFDILGIQDLEKTYHVDLIYMNACSSPEVVHHKMFAIDSSKMKPSTGDDNFQKKVFGIMDFEGKMKIGIIADSFESLVDKGKDWEKNLLFFYFSIPFAVSKL